jgi:hypothetical protein
MLAVQRLLSRTTIEQQYYATESEATVQHFCMRRAYGATAPE